MSRISADSDRDAVRDATDLAALIGEHLALRAQGREFVGLCPFHDDRKPSMHVVTHKGPGFYKCFACGASGDCFRFVMDFHKMDFGQALRYLAERAGITLTARSSRAEAEGAGRDLLKKINAAAAAHFRRMLADAQLGAAGRAVIEQRGISDHAAEQFGIGVAPPGFDRLTGRLQDRPEMLAAAIEAGIVRQRDDRTYDVFRNRLMFPIRSELGEPIAFGGRIIDPEDNPKYLNSPESPLFSKSRTLYALDLARRAIIDRKVAVVTEGYTDVIACHQAGFEHVVATLGTALTPEHAGILRRFCDTVILLFDGDEAGRKAADRGIEVLLHEPIDIRVCVLPDNADPDEILRRQDGAAQFAAALESSRDALDYLLDRFRTRLDASDGIGARQRVAESFLDDLARMGLGAADGVRRNLLLGRVASLLRIPVRDIEGAFQQRVARENRITDRRVSGDSAAAVNGAAPSATDDGSEAEFGAEAQFAEDTRPAAPRRRVQAERDVAAIIAFHPAILGAETCEHLRDWTFADSVAREVVMAFVDAVDAGRDPERLGLAALLEEFSGDAIRAEASRLFLMARDRYGDDELALREGFTAALAGLEACRREERLHERLVSLRDAGAGSGNPAEALAAFLLERREHALSPAAIARHRRSRT